jgi:hypothetical protein
MNVQELRIGNLIHYSGSYLTEDNNEFNESLAAYLLLVRDEWDFVKPIPLTEEWLLKFGFEQASDYWTEPGNGCFELGKQKEGWVYCVNTREYDVSEPIQYVHQLQNLFYAVTGRELTIKETVK